VDVADRSVVVVGAGIIGLAVAWRCAQRGFAVTLVEAAPTGAASRAAAGMLAPVTEVSYGEERLLALDLESARRYPAFLAELGADVGHCTAGTLAVALDTGDRAVLSDLHAYQLRLGLDAQLLSSRECRALEPMLAPAVRGGLLVGGDHSVDPRRLTAALHAAAVGAGVGFVPGAAAAVDAGSVTLPDGRTLAADDVVVAAGCWSAELTAVPVRPVKGQVLRLRGPGFLGRTVRGVVAGSRVYVVPRPDGEVVVGATSEELGFDTRVTAGGVYELLRDAHALLPGITELELVETTVGLRPGTPDNAPMIGRLDSGVVVATGHYRNGVLLAPVTADLVAELLTSGELPELARPFAPDRFAAVPA
jgi:glycine oxidase